MKCVRHYLASRDVRGRWHPCRRISRRPYSNRGLQFAKRQWTSKFETARFNSLFRAKTRVNTEQDKRFRLSLVGDITSAFDNIQLVGGVPDWARDYCDFRWLYDGLKDDQRHITEELIETSLFYYYHNLPVYDANSFKFVLPRTMIWQIIVSPRGALYIPDILRSLDDTTLIELSELRPVAQQSEVTELSTFQIEHWLENYKAIMKVLIDGQHAMFESFTSQQVHAVIRWLLFVRSWVEQEEDEEEMLLQINRTLKQWIDAAGA